MENEAIDFLKGKYPSWGCDEDEYKNAQTAIQALEEIQQYRAIGTVNGYERAIEISIENYNLYREYKAKVQEYEEIGTIEEFKALKEKSEPKKVIVKGVMGFDGEEAYCCPTCGLDNAQWGCNRCVDCGQALDWQ